MTQSAVASITSHIAVVDGQITTTTHDIAEVYGKRHDNVFAIVRQRMKEAGEWGVLNFKEASIERPQTNGGTVSYPVIRMTKKGFHFVVGKFTGAKAVQHQIAFADEFERMELVLTQPALPNHITPAQQSALQAIVARRAGESGGIRAALWSRFNNHFKLGSYKQLPAAQFDEACAYLEDMPLRSSSDRFSVTAAELDAMIAQRTALQLPEPAKAPCPSYNLPASVWQPANKIARTGWLTMAELERIPLERLPLNNLLAALQKDGHDIEGAMLEYQALRHLTHTMHSLLTAVRTLTADASNTGLRIMTR